MLKNNFTIAVTIAFAILILQACAPSITLDATWKNPEATSYSSDNILVVILGENMQSRMIAEDAFVTALKAKGYSTTGAFEILPTAAEVDSSTFRRIIKDKGFDLVLTARAVNVQTEQHWVPGTYNAPPYYGGYYGYYGRYGYYGASYSPGYMDETTTALLETNVYNANTTGGQLVWVGQSSVIVSGTIQKLAAKYAAVVVNGLIKDGVL
jgi:hypothetical protein